MKKLFSLVDLVRILLYCSRQATVAYLYCAIRKVLGRNQKDFSKQCGLDRSYFGGVERR
jgi:hypothetical protein